MADSQINSWLNQLKRAVGSSMVRVVASRQMFLLHWKHYQRQNIGTWSGHYKDWQGKIWKIQPERRVSFGEEKGAFSPNMFF